MHPVSVLFWELMVYILTYTLVHTQAAQVCVCEESDLVGEHLLYIHIICTFTHTHTHRHTYTHTHTPSCTVCTPTSVDEGGVIIQARRISKQVKSVPLGTITHDWTVLRCEIFFRNVDLGGACF